MRVSRSLLALLLPTTLAVSAGAAKPAEAALSIPHVLTSGAVGSARQVVLVTAGSTSSTYARLSWWLRTSDGAWHMYRGEVTARVGVHGMSTSKREGDGKTPIGVFPVGIGFGWYSNPGTKLYWRIADSNSRWVDDSDSAYYNLWMQAPAAGRWDSAERMRITPYTYGMQIAYNRERTPGKGSAIFLHLPTGGATAGCVAVDKATVIAALRWLNPSLHPVFVIGTKDWIAHH
jgi:L,D-peptidoglycan transpeptidase YkuD (ErfK/YbiS/YcfS/YnhG family)